MKDETQRGEAPPARRNATPTTLGPGSGRPSPKSARGLLSSDSKMGVSKMMTAKQPTDMSDGPKLSSEEIHRLVETHRPLVRAMAKRYAGLGPAADDLEQEGALGLLFAAMRFDPEYGTRFSTYARWWVRYRMQQFLRANRGIVPLPQTRAIQRTRRKLRSTSDRIRQETGDAVRDDALAEAIGVDVEDVVAVRMELSNRDVPVVEGREPGHQPQAAEDPEDQVACVERQRLAHRVVETALTQLDERERCIITERRLSDAPASLREIGARFAISGERVRQLETRALSKLKKELEKHGALEVAHTCAREAAA